MALPPADVAAGLTAMAIVVFFAKITHSHPWVKRPVRMPRKKSRYEIVVSHALASPVLTL
jgi:hypothetical protein